MAREIKEVAMLRTDLEKYSENYASIDWGKKEKLLCRIHNEETDEAFDEQEWIDNGCPVCNCDNAPSGKI